VVTTAIPAGTGASGQVKIGTEDWSVRPADDVEGIPSGTTVEVVGLEGVTALVRRVPA
jgi:membrane protein implicated in regulation of membrane protease activity